MKISVLRVLFHLHGCRSLKEKRQRLGRLRDKFGKQTALAVCESNFADAHQQSEWSFLAGASNAVVVEQTLADVERYVISQVDAEVVDLERKWLS